jgi:tetratricopeptide (TPR) repeat protein
MTPTLADLLGQHLHHVHTSVNRLAKLSGVPQRTIANWLNGTILKPRHWQDLVKVAVALHLTLGETDALLQIAGHPVVAQLHLKAVTDPDRQLLAITQPLAPTPAIAPVPKFPSPFQAIADLSTFVGRENELAEVKKALLNNGRAAICGVKGMGGVGKTSLAAHLAYQLHDDFPDGVLWARLDTSDTLTILGMFADAYGKDVSQYKDVESRAAVVRNVLAGKRVLIVLDNAQNSAEVRPLLPPSTGKPAVLITSRHDLEVTDGWAHQTVQPFTPQSGATLALFTRFLGEPYVRTQVEGLAVIGDLVGHLPLALAISAGKLASDPGLTAAAFAERLRQQDTRLGELTREDRSVRLTFDASYETLTPDLQQFFAVLGLFGGEDFGPDAAAGGANLSPEQAVTHLQQLYHLSLVQVGRPGRYRLHPLLRDYAQEKLTDVEAIGRVTTFYIEAVASLRSSNFKSLEGEIGNIVAVLNTIYQQGMAEWFLRAALAFQHLLRSFGLYALADGQMNRAEEIARRNGEVNELAQVLHRVGEMKHVQGFIELGQQYFAESLALAQSAGNRPLECELLERLGRIEEALSLARAIGHETFLPLVVGNLGVKMGTHGDFAAAESLFQESVQLARPLGQYHVIIPMTHNQAWLAYQRGDFARADQLNEEAIALAREVGQYEVLLGALLNHGESLFARDKVAEGEKQMQEALELSRQFGNLGSVGGVLAELGWQAFRRRQLEKARGCWQEVLEIGDKIGNQLLQCLSRAYWAEYCLQVGQLDEAERCGREALALAPSLNHPWYMAEALFAVAQIEERRGRVAEARVLAQESLDIFRVAQHVRTGEVAGWLERLGHNI